MDQANDQRPSANDASPSPPLIRGIGVSSATALNMIDMIGVGPFITLPLIVSAMGGPQAMLGWVIGAVLAMCDGLVWSELGAALPGSGGSYHFLREIFGRYAWGRLLPFLFIWQFLISGALEMSSGYIGGLQYLEYALPDLAEVIPQQLGGTRWFAAAAAILVSFILCQNIRRLGWLSVGLCAGTMITVLTVIVAGLLHFHSAFLTLPAKGNSLDVRTQVGVGRMELTVPASVSLNARVKGGIGETLINLPLDAAVRLEANNGIGDVNVGSRFHRVGGHNSDWGLGKNGVWETANFATAIQKINIRYEGGIGQLTVR
jgi:amino acid transporter